MFAGLGAKLRNVASLGGKMLAGAGQFGRKAINTGQTILKSLEGVPVIGDAIKSLPFYNSVKSGLKLGGQIADVASLAGNTLSGQNTIMQAAGKAQSCFMENPSSRSGVRPMY